jgi:hypothetical protein
LLSKVGYADPVALEKIPILSSNRKSTQVVKEVENAPSDIDIAIMPSYSIGGGSQVNSKNNSPVKNKHPLTQQQEEIQNDLDDETPKGVKTPEKTLNQIL